MKQIIDERYRVIRIPDTYSVLINAGEINDVEMGDKFQILGKSEEIIDPFSNESLGYLDYVKATVEVVQLYEKMCLCENALRQPSMLTSTLSAMSIGFASSRLSLDVNENQLGVNTNSEDDVISIGDMVKLVKRNSNTSVDDNEEETYS